MKMIPLSVPTLNGPVLEYLRECVETNWVSSAGAFVDRFEESIASYVGAKHAVACNSGTAALHLALLAAGVRDGDEVLIPTLTFIAPVNAISYVGAKPVFFDCDSSFCMDMNSVIKFVESMTREQDGFTYNAKTGARISAILPVHIWGNMCDFGEALNLLEDRGITVVEDASEALGTRLKGSGVGSGKHAGTLGKLGCFSFNGNKIITSGGGGMVVTDDDKMAKQVRHLSTQAKVDEIHYLHDRVGYNYRLTNVQAAIGVAQLECLPDILMKKKRVAEIYESICEPLKGIDFRKGPSNASNNCWLNVAEISGWAVSDIVTRAAELGIQVRPVWELNHRHAMYSKHQVISSVEAERLRSSCVCLPSSPNLSGEELGRIEEFLRGCQL